MIKLKPLYEIKISSGITVEMLDKLGTSLSLNKHSGEIGKLCEEYFKKRKTFKYTSWPDWLSELPQNEKNNLYQEFLKLKNESLPK